MTLGDRLSTFNRVLNLRTVSYFNTIPTIYDDSYGSLQNDVIEYKIGEAAWQKQLLGPGKYHINDFVMALNKACMALSATTPWTYDPILMRLRLLLAANEKFRLRSANGAYAVLGSSHPVSNEIGGKVAIGVNGSLITSLVDKETHNIMPFVPDMSAGINSIYIYIEPAIVEGISNGSSMSSSFGSLIGVIPVVGKRGHQNVFNDLDSVTFPIEYHTSVDALRVRFLDSTGYPIQFGRLECTIELKISLAKHTDM